MFGWKIYQVAGHSMEPTLKSGQYVLGRPATNIRPGDLVVCRYDQQLLIKRVKTRTAQGFYVQSDNPSGQDSRDFGLIPQGGILKKVVWY